MGCQRDDGCGARGIVVGSGIEDLLAQIAQVVVMRREDVAAVVPLACDLGNDIETFVVFQEFVVDICFNMLYSLDGLWRYPDDGLVDHLLAVCLEKLDGCFPRVDESGIGAFSRLLQTGKFLTMLVGEPEFASHETVGVFRLGQVGKHTVGIEVQCVYMIDGELSVHARRILSHGEIHAGTEFPAICPHLHLAAERIDIQLKGLQRHLVYTRLLKLLLQILSCLVSTTLGIAATLILGAA